jgi:hypothetical protein
VTSARVATAAGTAQPGPGPAVRARKPPPPPECPPGWAVAAPDFIGVGTMRSGTSWWHYLISCHPGVTRAGSRDKELHYFDQFALGGGPDPRAYSQYFPRPAGQIAGEWTPRYIADHWAPGLIAAVAPEARLLVLLRDPVDRMVSGISYTQSDDQELSHTQINLQLYRSMYWAQLENLLGYFPRGQVLVLQYEKCVADPEGELGRTFTFLGLDPSVLRFTPSMLRPVNALRVPRMRVGEDTRTAICAALRADLRLLAQEFPEIDQSLWPSSGR